MLGHNALNGTLAELEFDARGRSHDDDLSRAELFLVLASDRGIQARTGSTSFALMRSGGVPCAAASNKALRCFAVSERLGGLALLAAGADGPERVTFA